MIEAEIEAEIQKLFDRTQSQATEALVTSMDGTRLFSFPKDQDEMVGMRLAAATGSALSVSQNFLNSVLEDSSDAYVLLKDETTLVASKSGDIGLLVTFERDPQTGLPLAECVSQTKKSSRKISAILQAQAAEPLAARIMKEFPDAISVSLLTSGGIPISTVLKPKEVDEAFIGALSAALSLSAKSMLVETRFTVVVGKKTLAFFRELDGDRILVVTLPKKDTVESYLRRIEASIDSD